MKTMIIYEPSMCCPTGLCGVGIDKELLRISSVLSNLEKNGVKVVRYNLSNTPEKFAENQELGKLLEEKGIDILPVTTVDGVIVKTGAYPTNNEIAELLEIPDYLAEDNKNEPVESSSGCCGDSSASNINSSPIYVKTNSGCTPGGGCC